MLFNSETDAAKVTKIYLQLNVHDIQVSWLALNYVVYSN